MKTRPSLRRTGLGAQDIQPAATLAGTPNRLADDQHRTDGGR